MEFDTGVGIESCTPTWKETYVLHPIEWHKYEGENEWKKKRTIIEREWDGDREREMEGEGGREREREEEGMA